MSNRICPTCGEEYSTTYRTCPFCEEEKAIRQGHPPHRQGGKRLEKQRAKSNGGAGGVLMLLTGVIILGALAYVFFGDKIAGTMGIRSDPEELGFMYEDDETEDKQTPVAPANVDTPPEGSLILSQSAITLAAGETALLTVTGGEGEAVWTSSDEQIATVKEGAVTAHAGGTATITVVIGEESAACAVEVEGEPPTPPEPTGTQPTSSGSSVKLSLNKTDFTLRSGDPPVQMKVNGTDSAVTWASKNTSVVTVSDTGLVTRAGSGRTTITATVDGQVLECTVRVP